MIRAPLGRADLLALVGRVHPHYRPVWDGLRSAEERLALAAYFLPHRSSRPVLGPTRPRVVKWYCPFAPQRLFPSGHRYCVNVYTGCAHGCRYCYAAAYEPVQAAGKRDYRRLLEKDLTDLEAFGVPPAPVHLSNSTDPHQPLEARTGHARHTLERLLAHRSCFTTVTLITKNPGLAVELGALPLLRALGETPSPDLSASSPEGSPPPGCQVEVSLAFWRDVAAAAYDPGAPTPEERCEGILALREAGIPVVLRIDPLFPRSPLPLAVPAGLPDFGVPEAQTLDDLQALVEFACRAGVRHVVYSAAKIVRPRWGPLDPLMEAWRAVYAALAAPGKPVWRSLSWRLPEAVAREHVFGPFLRLCAEGGMAAKHCCRNLLETG
ncbi:MAG: hypothetical protein AB1505_23145 [Candidatus Latescibacterota bacterium]